jgi:hypothetical protein
MTAKELRKSLANGLRLDSSGKTNPVQRLAPFLDDLVSFLEEYFPEEVNTLLPLATISEQVSSDVQKRVATVLNTPNSVPDGATKATDRVSGAEAGEK